MVVVLNGDPPLTILKPDPCADFGFEDDFWLVNARYRAKLWLGTVEYIEAMLFSISGDGNDVKGP
jgi:hypothetical protein